MNLSLEEKTAVVCGSSKGIGLAIAEELALLGANCILISRNEASLQEAVQKLDIANRQLHSYKVADFSRPEQVRNAIRQVVGSNTVHILVNNTGGPPPGAIIDATEDEFVEAFHQHLICNHILTQAVVPGMKASGFGRIINVISTSVKIPNKNLGVSNTIRGGVASWAKTLANELGEFNITVNNVLPGYTGTQRLKTIIERNAVKRNVDRDIVEKEMMHEVPMKRFADASEIAAMAAFLATPAASYVNGVSIQVDGGRVGSI